MFRRISLAAALLAALTLAVLTPAAIYADAGDEQFSVAAGHYKRARWPLAVEEFQAFIQKYPQHARLADAQFFLGEALVQLGRPAESREHFRAFLAKNPDHRFVKQAGFRVGEASYLLEDFQAARTELADFRGKYPDDKLNGFVLPYLGELALADGQWEQAQALFEDGLKRFPEGKMQDDCRFGLARVLEKRGDAEQATHLYVALAAKTASPLADDAQFRLGALEYSQGRYADAIKSFEAFETESQDSPYKPRARLGRGRALFQLGELAKAKKYFEALTKSDEVGVEAGYWLGMTQKSQQEWTTAATTLDGIKFDARHELAAAITFHAGDALLRAGNPAAAAERFDRVLAEWPQDEICDEALLARAQLALLQHDHATVDRLAERAAKERPNSRLWPEILRTRVRSLIERKEYAAASKVIEPLVVAAGDAPAAWDAYLLAAAYLGEQRYEDALKRLAQVQVENAAGLQNEACLTKASALMGLKRFNEAIQPLQELLKRQPDGPLTSKCQAQLTVCLAQAGNFEEARTVYEALLVRKPDDGLRLATTQQLAEAALAAGKFEQAAQMFAAIAVDETPAEFAAPGLSGLAWSQYRAGKLAESADAFQRLIVKHPDSPLAAEGALVRGQILEKLDRPEDALASYLLVIDKYSAQGDLAKALHGAARLQHRLQRDEQAAVLYQRLAQDFPDLPDRDAILYEWAWALRQLNQWDQADEQFQQIRAKYPQSKFRADALYRLAERAHQVQDQARADEYLIELLKSNPPPAIEQHALYLMGQTAIGRGQWDAVVPPLRQLVEKHPESPLRLSAEYLTADAEYRRGDYAAATRLLTELAPKLAGSQEKWAAMVPLRRAQSLVQQKKFGEARKIAQGIARDFPDFEQQYEADYVIGRCLASQAEFEKAREAYQRVIQSESGQGTETAAKAQWMLGETYYHQKNYQAALREYLRLEILYDYPVWQAAALLEAGKCHEQLGEWKQAAEMYQRVLKEFPEAPVKDDCQQRLRIAQERVASKK